MQKNLDRKGHAKEAQKRAKTEVKRADRKTGANRRAASTARGGGGREAVLRRAKWTADANATAYANASVQSRRGNAERQTTRRDRCIQIGECPLAVPEHCPDTHVH